ncbi:hybrid sensor histidine kinase/response regulator [Mucisphaera calidilacus]|uniref:hybrid sensor histidine kinase/response regulator n=1 Tax=Mucisphaera calidilacus TaxID=2527982 RepID=UPI00119D8174|nr:hybrid sensor histidine kinase/response regulator [Mucisphaera calidilacus]
MRFSSSLSGRILLLGILPTVVILTALILALAVSGVRRLHEQSLEALELLANEVATQISHTNEHAGLGTIMMAQAQQAALFGQRETSVEFAREVLDRFPQLNGVSFVYEPDADGQDALWVGGAGPLAAGMDDRGRFLPYWSRGENGSLVLAGVSDPDARPGYAEAKRWYEQEGEIRAVMGEPVRLGDKMLIELTYPIIVDGRFVGAATIDRSLTTIRALLERIKTDASVDIFVISGEHRFVAATTAERELLKTQPVDETAYHKLFSREALIGGIEGMYDPYDGEAYYFATSQVRAGGWTLVVRESRSAIVDPIRVDFTVIVSTVVVALLAVLSLSMWILRHTSTRIRRAVEVADQLARRDLSGDLDLRSTSRDEVTQLGESFQSLVATMRETEAFVGAVAEGDFSRTFEQRSEADNLARSINAMSRMRQEAEAALREARLEAEQANVAKSVFLANMSHELRTPLNGVLGYVQILLRDRSLNEQQRRSLDAIMNSGEHLLMLINDILDLSKIEAGRLEVDLAACDLHKLLQSVEDVLAHRAKSKSLAFEVDVAAEVPRGIRTDATKLKQVLVNLAGNAVKFTEAGSVTISVGETEDKRLRFSVRDTGIGMSEEELAGIFDAFKQAAAGKDAGGTGLGLTISRRLVLALGGVLSVESRPGAGSTFSFTHPLEEVDEDALSLEQTASLAGHASLSLPEVQRRTVLVVDDREANREILDHALRGVGFATEIAENGREALDVLEKTPVDAVLMDVRMPVMNGIEATERLRADERFRDLPVIAVSASVFPNQQKKFREAGCSDFLAKPVRLNELFEKLAHHLGLTYTTEDAAEEPMRATTSEPLSAERAGEVVGPLREALRVRSFTALNALAERLAADEATASVAERIRSATRGFDFDALDRLADELERGD